MVQPFEHGFTNPLTEKSMNEILGYIKALRDFHNHIKEATQYNPEKRMIDSVLILDRISATSGELSAIFTKEQEALDEMAVNILSGTK